MPDRGGERACPIRAAAGLEQDLALEQADIDRFRALIQNKSLRYFRCRRLGRATRGRA